MIQGLLYSSHSERREFVTRHPATLSSEMDSLLAALEWNQQNEPARALFIRVRTLLRDCREKGIEAAFAHPTEEELEEDQDPHSLVIRVIKRFCSAATLEEKKAIALANPILLGKEAEVFINRTDDPHLAAVFPPYKLLLDRCRMIGIEAAFAEQTAYQARSGKIRRMLAGITALLPTVGQWEREQVFRLYPELLEKETEDLLRTLTREVLEEEGVGRSGLDLANLLKDLREKGIHEVWPFTDKTGIGYIDSLERTLYSIRKDAETDPKANAMAIETCTQLLEHPSVRQDLLQTANYRYILARALHTSSKADPSKKADPDRVIALLEKAVTELPIETDPKLYAELISLLAYELIHLPTGDREYNQLRAMEHYLLTMDKVNPAQYPKEYATMKSNIGVLFLELVAWEKETNVEGAIRHLEEGLKYCPPELDEELYVLLHMHLGCAHLKRLFGYRQDNISTAIRYFEKALQIAKARRDPKRAIALLSNLSVAYREQAKAADDVTKIVLLEKAIDCMHSARGLNQPGSDAREMASTQLLLAEVYARLPASHPFSKEGRAPAIYRQCYEGLAPGQEPDIYATATRGLAKYYFDRDQWTQAWPVYRKAIHAAEELYRRNYFRTGRGNALADMTGLYDEMAYVLYRLGRTPEALEMAEEGRSRLLREQLLLRAARPPGVPDPVWEGYESAAHTLCLWDLQSSGYAEFRDHKTEDYLADLEALEKAIEAVRRTDPNFCREIPVASVIQAIPDEYTALLVISITRKGSILFVLDRSEAVAAFDLPALNRTTIRRLLWNTDKPDQSVDDGWLGSFLNQENESDGLALEARAAQLDGLLPLLGRVLAEPVSAALPARITRLVFVVPGRLSLLPLHAAPMVSGYGDTLWDRFVISYAPSLTLWYRSRERWSVTGSPVLYMAVNPTSDENLPFARLEADLIQSRFPAAMIRHGEEATREALGTAFCEAEVVHLSCHAGFDWRKPMDSGIRLADGLLNLEELLAGDIALGFLEGEPDTIVAVRVRPQSPMLVTLSACETAMIDFREGSANEFIGIPAGFLVTGIPAVVSSGWKVADITAAMYMWRFYSALAKGRRIAEALREAGLWLRDITAGRLAALLHAEKKEAGRVSCLSYALLSRAWRQFAFLDPAERPFRHPIHYAAFVVNGSGGLPIIRTPD